MLNGNSYTYFVSSSKIGLDFINKVALKIEGRKNIKYFSKTPKFNYNIQNLMDISTLILDLMFNKVSKMIL